MIKRDGQYQVEIKEKMRGGEGAVRIEHLWTPGDEMKANNRLFAKLILEPGSSIGFHRHDNEEEVFYVVKGRAEADDDGKVSLLNPGDTILTGGGAGHAIKSVGDTALELLAVISKY